MTKEYSSNIVKLTNLADICKGDRAKELRYLRQFTTLIPQRIELLRQAMEKDNLKAIRMEIHKMSPQAEFFGIYQVVRLKKVLEFDDGIYSSSELKDMISDIISILDRATQEISEYLRHAIDGNQK